PARSNIAAPGVGAISLLARKSGAGEDGNPFGSGGGPLMVIDAADMSQRESIPHAPVRAEIGGQIEIAFLFVQMVGLRRIQPPGVGPKGEDAFVEIPPIDVPRYRVIHIIGKRSAIRRPGCKMEQHMGGIQFAVLRSLWAETRPGDNKKVGVHPVDAVDHVGGSRVVDGVEAHGVPVAVLTPILPVLYDHIQRYLERSVSPDDIYQLEL